jgi:hypothetical protein
MKLSELKNALSVVNKLNFKLPNGKTIPAHFHITEVGLSSKHFMDCGNQIHVDKWANLQIWVATDLEHRLKPSALLKIIESSKRILGEDDLEVEVEYQTDTIGKYGLDLDEENFVLVAKSTDCLAQAVCGTPKIKQKMVELVTMSSGCCTPGGGCC